MAPAPITEVETTLAAEQKGKLVKSLGRFDAIFFIVATIVGLAVRDAFGRRGGSLRVAVIGSFATSCRRLRASTACFVINLLD